MRHRISPTVVRLLALWAEHPSGAPRTRLRRTAL